MKINNGTWFVKFLNNYTTVENFELPDFILM